jgi:hypothetical protein
MDLYRRLTVPAPIIVMLTFTSVRDCVLATPHSGDGWMPHDFDRDDLVLPGTLVQGFSQSPKEICRPIFDALWNAAGQAKWEE